MLRRAGKAFAGLAVGLVVMAGALPAIAQVDGITQINIKKPSPAQIIAGVQGIDVEVRSSASNMIKSVTVSIRHDASRDCAGPDKKKYDAHRYDNGPAGASNAPESVTVSEQWDTGQITPLNGVYDVFVVVEGSKAGGLGINDEAACQPGIRVNNRPHNVKGAAASLQDGKPEVRWAANSEDDITGYRVVRSVGGASKQVAFTTATSYRDTDKVPEELPYEAPISYQVTAYRASPVDPHPGIAADPVGTSAVVIPAPPPPPSPSPSAIPGGIKASPMPSATPLKDLSGKLGSVPPPSKVVKPVSLAAPNPVTGPRRDGGSGFGRLLPFGQEAPGTFIDEEFAEAVGEAIRNPGRMVSQQIRVNPLRFIAAAVLLLVTAGHLGRGAHTLFHSAKESAGETSPPVPA